MDPDVPNDEDLLRRFLVGEVSDQEREQVERRFIADPDFYDSLRGLEEEMLLSYHQGRLPDRWRLPFESHVLATAEGRRDLDRMGAFQDALAAARPGVPAAVPPQRRWWGFEPGFGLMWAGAAAVLVLAAGLWVSRDERGGAPVAPDAAQRNANIARPLATFVLVPGLTRSDLRQSNIFRLPAGSGDIRLELTVPADGVGDVDAELKPVGGAPLRIASRPQVRSAGNSLVVSWLIPANDLKATTDYLLTLWRSSTSPGEREAIASRFFSTVE
jgi:hypothetical protein